MTAEELTPIADDEDDLPSWAEGWRILWTDLVVDDQVLGRGNFGEVRSGAVRRDGKLIKAAVKFLKGELEVVLAELQTEHTMQNHVMRKYFL